jgi:hypothetical protein
MQIIRQLLHTFHLEFLYSSNLLKLFRFFPLLIKIAQQPRYMKAHTLVRERYQCQQLNLPYNSGVQKFNTAVCALSTSAARQAVPRLIKMHSHVLPYVRSRRDRPILIKLYTERRRHHHRHHHRGRRHHHHHHHHMRISSSREVK